MFKPKYTLTSKLLNNITACERFYGQLEGLKIPKEIELNLEINNTIRSSYISNSIEGNPLSLPEVTNLLLNERMPVNKDEKEVFNYYNILKNLANYDKEVISLQAVLNIHKDLLQGVNNNIAGKIRNKKIIVGKYTTNEGKLDIHIKHNPPTHKQKEITNRMIQLIDWEKESDDPIVIKAGIFHHEFVFIHPFEDGNGRSCRLLTALLFLKEKYYINKYFVLDDYYDIDRHLYSDSLHTADSGNKTKWLEYFSDGVKYSLQSALGRVKNALNTLKISQRPTPKEKEVLKILEEQNELISIDLAQKLKVSRQQAHNLLNALVEKGLIEKKGSTKASYYCLK